MGTVSHSIAKSGYSNNNVRGRLVDSGAHTTSTSASNLTNGAAGGGSAITGNKGDILSLIATEDVRVMFGGEAATATVGHIVPADILVDLEISGTGTISVIDVA